jgi:SSS family solute:Na+ symporter
MNHVQASLAWPDFGVLGLYLAGLSVLGIRCARRTRDSDHFVAAGRSVPGWALALTLFGSFVSSISFLAQPGKAYAGNWNPFVFCFALPVAAWIGVRVFVPFFRRTGEVSAYAHLERRFGPWARTYATVCFILLQLTRTGVVAYLLALALAPAFGVGADGSGLFWILLAIVGLMTVFPLFGGTDAAIWTGAAQSLVLVLGIVVSLGTVLVRIPGGPGEVFRVAAEHHKFSLGSWDFSFAGPTVLVVFLYALTENLRNFGINQTYVQLYAAARGERDARACVWAGAAMYVPLAAMTFLVGTSLFAFYRLRPDLLPEGLPGDRVFPHFICTQLPAGLRGLVLAAVCAAATDSGFSYVATLIQGDLYKRYLRPAASDGESLLVLRGSTLLCGVVTVAVAAAMTRAKHALDAWWGLAGIAAGGMLGLFLLGLLCRRAGSRAGIVGVSGGTLAILWMTLSLPSFETTVAAVFPGFRWPLWMDPLRFPGHEFMISVIGTAAVMGLGILAGLFFPEEER